MSIFDVLSSEEIIDSKEEENDEANVFDVLSPEEIIDSKEEENDEVIQEGTAAVDIFSELSSDEILVSEEDTPEDTGVANLDEGGWFFKGEVQDAEVKALAEKYGKSEEWVKEEFVKEGATASRDIVDPSLFIPAVAGAIQRDFLLNIPRKISKKLFYEKEDTEVLDEITRLTNEKESTLQSIVIGFIAPLGAFKTVAATAGVIGRSKGIAKVAGAIGDSKVSKAVVDKADKVFKAITFGADQKKIRAATEVAKASGIGGLAGYGMSTEENEVQGALIGASFGLGMGAAGSALTKLFSIKQVNKVIEKVDMEKAKRASYNKAVSSTIRGEEVADEVLDAAVKEIKPSQRAIENLMQRSVDVSGEVLTPEQASRILVKNRIEGSIYHLARSSSKALGEDVGKATQRGAVESIQKLARSSEENAKLIDVVYDSYVSGKAVVDLLQRGELSKLQTTIGSGVGYGVDYMIGAQHVANKLDLLHGTAIEPALHDLILGISKHNNLAVAWMKNIRDPFVDKLKATGVDRVTLGKIMRGGEVSKEYEPAANLIRQAFADLAEASKKAGQPIDLVEGYMRQQVKSPQAFYATVADMSSKANLLEPGLRGDAFTKAASVDPDIKSMIKFMENYTEKKITSSVDMIDAMNMINPNMMGTKSIQSFVSSTLKKRKGEIPEFLMENDPVKLVDSWILMTSKSSMIRKELAALDGITKQLDTLGDMQGSRFVDNIIKDAYGVREGIAQKLVPEAQKSKFEWGKKAAAQMRELEVSKAGITDTKELAKIQDQIDQIEFSKGWPNVQANLSNLMYSNLLGWSVDKPLRNMTQPFAVTAAEVGGIYGQSLAVKGMVSAVGEAKGTIKRLSDMGELSDQTSRENVATVANVLGKTKWFSQYPKKVIEWYARKGLTLYQASDTANRMITLKMSDMLAQDYKAGKAGAVKFVDEVLGVGYRNLIKSGKISVEEAVSKHLLNRTQFSYTRAALSEFAKDCGPLLRTFSKWGSEVSGDVASKIREGRSVAAFNKYLAPYAMLTSFDKAFEEELQNPHVKTFVGQGGKTAALAPIQSLSGMFSGDLITSPHLDTLMGLFSGNLKKGLTDAFEIYGLAGPLNALARGNQAITGEEFEKVERSLAERFFQMIE